MATKQPTWKDKTPMSTDNVFNWNTGAESVFATDSAIRAATTIAKSRETGKISAANPKAAPITNLSKKSKFR